MAVGPLVSIGTWSSAIWGKEALRKPNLSTSSKDTDQDELPHIDDDDKDDGENIGAEYYHRVL